MNVTVPSMAIVMMVVVALVGIALPILLLILFRKKFKAPFLPFFIGCAVFLVFALIIEGTINRLILSSSFGKTLQGNIWLFGIFGGLMAGVFEETGRFTAFKTVLKKYQKQDTNALMYGAGHGGFEAFYILVASMVSYIAMAVMVNAGLGDKLTAGIKDPTTLQALNATISSLSTTPPIAYLAGIVERIAAVALHISLSVLVWFAAKNRRQLKLYPLAIGIHAFVDFIAVILSKNGVNIWIIEAIIYVLVACSILLSRALWKKYHTEDTPTEPPIADIAD